MTTTPTTIKKVAVIGSGVMGSGIAAQVANAGVDVLLMDIAAEGDDANAIVKSSLAKLQKVKPAALMHKRNAKRISIGNLNDDMEKLKDCDWIIEVVIERLDIKQNLYKQINKHRKAGSIVSSNTSTLPLEDLTNGMPKGFKKDFLITHFFNPPRYLRLLEIVASEETDEQQVDKVCAFADIHLGKSIVKCNDRPGFIANRIGTYWLHAAVSKAVKQGITVEEADMLLSRPAGVPKTGVFGLIDLVGLDLMPHIFESFEKSLERSDAFQKLGKAPDLIEKMIKDGYTGRKGKGGFYRLNTEGSKKNKEVINLQTGDFAPAARPKVPAVTAAKKGGLRAMVSHESKHGKYAWDVLSNTLSYAASLIPEIAGTLEEVDRAMCLGYNWKKGPFQLMDEMGTEWFAAKLRSEGRPVPHILDVAKGRPFYRTNNGVLEFLTLDGAYRAVPRPEGVLLLQDVKRRSKPIFKNISASVWDLGDGIACLEFTSKMNSLNPFIIAMVNRCVKNLPKMGYKGMVIHNEGTNFSVGANLAMLLVASKLKLSPFIRWILRQGQFAFDNMKYSNFPVVGAPSGMALGGGCEILLHCDALEGHAETYIGLVEAGVGIVPGWGGCKELLVRGTHSAKVANGPMPAVSQAFQTIATAQVATSAQEARDLLFFRETDGIVMNKDRVLASAKSRVLKILSDGYTPPERTLLRLPGATGATALELAVLDFAKKGVATPHDVTVARELAFVLSGGGTDVTEEVSEHDILKLERDALTNLAKTKQTYARIKHMLTKGKPLRN